MTAHTPGPWIYRHKNDGVYTAPPEGTNCTYGELIFAFNEDFSPSSSDLPLILAAPDLLAVAQHSATALRLSGVEANAHSENPIEWLLHQAEAAIAKAKGEKL